MSFRWSPLVLAIIGQAAIAAPSIMLDEDTKLDYSITLSYTGSQRLKHSAQEYLSSPNNDDATRNFKRGSFITNRLNALADIRIQRDNIGAILNGSTFYDAAYHGTNDNNSPGTVNKFGTYNRFNDSATDISGQKSRLLDAYVYGSWLLDQDRAIGFKLGRHVLAWGESMFWANISQGMSPLDGTKFNVPGTEAKEGYLPVGQLSGSLALAPSVSLIGFYQYKWEPTQLSPVGDYFNSSDVFGPGAEFIYAGVNKILYAGEERPRNSGQWGLGARFQVDAETELGLYHYRYHNRVGTLFNETTGTTQYSSLPGFNAAGGTYKLGYFDDIKLTGASLSTKFGDAVQMGADFSYRDGAPVNVMTPGGSAPARGSYLQANVNAVYILGPSKLAYQTTLLGEVMHQRINGVDALTITGGGAKDGTYSN